MSRQASESAAGEGERAAAPQVRTRRRIAEVSEAVRAASVDASRRTLEVQPGPSLRTVKTASGEVLEVPAGWTMLAPGDATLTRRVKASGPTWTVMVRRKRREMSVGVWADAERIERHRAVLERERETVEYKSRLAASRERRAKVQDEYVEDFEQAVFEHLRFAARHAALARRLAKAVAAHATPVGSGTVARTQRISLEDRAAHAVTAWLRHQTTDYDRRRFRNKSERSAARKELARAGKKLLARYRAGEEVAECLLASALERTETPRTEASAISPFRQRRRGRGASGGSGVEVDADPGAESEDV